MMVENDGPLGDAGPLSFYNIMRTLVLIGVVGTLVSAWSLTPWFPWK